MSLSPRSGGASRPACQRRLTARRWLIRIRAEVKAGCSGICGGPRQSETGADQAPDRGGLHRLRVQAGADPAVGGREQPVQRLAGRAERYPDAAP
jgi:hypothetical protein